MPVTSARRATRLRAPARGRGHELLLAQPANGVGDSVADVDPRPPAEQSLGLLDRRPAPLDVDLEGRQVLELEPRGILVARLPDDARDLAHRTLVARGDVEVLVLARRVRHRGDDAVGDVVHVGERTRLLAGAEDLE